MTLAEMFIIMTIKGTDTVDKAMGGVEKGMGKVSSASIEAKAAVLAVIYALEQATVAAANQGQALRSYEIITGESAQALQDWAYAGLSAKITADEMAGHFKSLWQVIANFKAGHGLPEGASLLGIDFNKIRTAEELMEQLHQAARKLKPDMAFFYEKNFGVDEKLFRLFREMEHIKHAPNKLGEGEIKQLDAMSLAWEKLWYNIRNDSAHANSKYGMEGIKELTEAYKGLKDVVKEMEHLYKVSGDLKVLFLGLVPIIAAVFGPIPVAVAALMALLAEYEKHKEGKDSVFGEQKEKNMVMDAGKDFFGWFSSGQRVQDLKNMFLKGGNDKAFNQLYDPNKLIPHTPFPLPAEAPTKTQTKTRPNVTVHQHGVDLSKPGDQEAAARRAFSDVARQLPDEE